MICSNCGKPNEDENNFCKHCGHDLKISSADPNRTIFNTSRNIQTSSNTDLGYLIVAGLVLINVCMWIFWAVFAKSVINENTGLLYKVLRAFSVIFTIGQFVAMIIFSKRLVFRVIIIVIAAIVIIYDLYWLIESFKIKY